jgi:2-C-methyl-D-erythritol 4-phosphate cytidylyltransferase
MSSSARTWAVIVAAGRGVRFGSGEAKQFLPLAGRPTVLWAIDAFLTHESIAGLTVVLPRETVESAPDWLERLMAEGVTAVPGGAERTDSVRMGLATVPNDMELVAVHDGARPLISSEAISRVIDGTAAGRGAIAGRRVTDSLKEADGEGRVLRSVDRESLWRAETPQAFPRELIVDVYRRAEADGVVESDCAALCERYGIEVVLVEIFGPNPKVTHPRDLLLVEALLGQSGRQVRETPDS